MANSVTVDLPDNLTIATVESLQEQLDPFAMGSQDVVLNGEGVERADTAGLQLLYAFSQALKSHNAQMSWLNPSSVLTEAANNLGLSDHLALN